MLSATALVVIVHALTPPPLASPQQTPRPAPGSSLGRRSVLLGATSSLAALWAPVPARARMDPAELADIVERAKVGQLSTDRVISRALQNNLIDPKDVKNCGALEAIRYIDLQTITELTPAQRGLRKLADSADAIPGNRDRSYSYYSDLSRDRDRYRTGADSSYRTGADSSYDRYSSDYSRDRFSDSSRTDSKSESKSYAGSYDKPSLSVSLRAASDELNTVLNRLNDQLAKLQSESLSRACDGRIESKGSF
jgi:hypothetical protein